MSKTPKGKKLIFSILTSKTITKDSRLKRELYKWCVVLKLHIMFTGTPWIIGTILYLYSLQCLMDVSDLRCVIIIMEKRFT